MIGASTGGTRVVPEILVRLPVLQSAVLLVQHLPAFITPSFVRTLSRYSRMPVRVAENRAELASGTVVLVPGGWHAELVNNRWLALNEGPRVNFVRPSVDVTFKSVVRPPQGERVVGVILTGMGKDGAQGLAHLKAIGARTLAQRAETCAVFGMPKAAIALGAATDVLSPDEIAGVLAGY